MPHPVPDFDSLCEELILADPTSAEDIDALKESADRLTPDFESLPSELADHLAAFLDKIQHVHDENSFQDVLQLMQTSQAMLNTHLVTEPTEPEQGSSEDEPPEPVEPTPGEICELKELDPSRIQKDADLVAAFIAEAQEHLETIDLQMLIWERNPDNKDTINDVFRPFHTIKGIASFLELEDIRDLSHALEDLLAGVRNNQLSYSQELANAVFQGADWLRTLISLLESILNGEQPSLPPLPLKSFILKIRKRLGENTEALQAAMEGRQSARERLLNQALSSEASPELGSDSAPRNEPLPASEPEPVPKTKPESTTTDETEPPPQTQKKQNPRRQSSLTTRFMRVDTSKMDSLLDLVGELVISNNIIQGGVDELVLQDPRLATELAQMRRIVNALQYNALSLRMVPISNTFQKMGRVVRDTSGKLGKKIELQLSGESTEVDRNIVDEIYEPLVHMIRNACDHGIESPAEREAAQKDSEGHICLHAGHQDGCIVIILQDDGRGIQPEKIHNIAVQKGIIQETAKLSRSETLKLIFAPGFSTASEITDVSGRGVGMDIVTRTLEKLRGSLDVDSTPNEGTIFTLKFPLTLAIMEGMIVGIDDQKFIIPTMNVLESLRPLREQCVSTMGKGEMIRIREQLIPLLRIHEVFDLKARHRYPWEGIVVVVEAEGRPHAVLVDELLGKQEIVIKSLGEKLKGLKGIAGGAILGDGKVGLILDIGQLKRVRAPSKEHRESEHESI